MPKLGWVAPASEISMAYYLAMWGIFTFFLFIGTFKISRALQVVFGTLVILFFMLAYGDATGNAEIKMYAGYEGIFCGASAIYTGMASLLNEVYGKEVLPIGAVSA
jgi:succinate-acetate transporter protein